MMRRTGSALTKIGCSGDPTCREDQVVEAVKGTELINVAWNPGLEIVRHTSVASARWHLLPDALPSRP